MQYRKLGTSDLNCSVIGLGTWPMSGNAYGRVDDRQSIAAILASIEAGVNFIDTAPAYGNGHAESVLGEALKSVAREKVIIATKFGNRFDEDGRYIRDASAKCVREGIEASLRRLGTDYIDLWQCHWPDPSTPIEETMEEVARHVESGKVRYVGVSNFNGALMDEARKYVPIVSLQPPYSLLDRGFEGEIQDYCLKNKIGVLSYGSIGSGILTGKYSLENRPVFPEGDSRAGFYRKLYTPEVWPRVCAMVDVLKEIAAGHNAPTVSAAINWVLAQKAVTLALVGAKTAEQARQNASAADWSMSEDELARIAKAYDEIFAE